jgi:phosphatidylserine decarboxylase
MTKILNVLLVALCFAVPAQTAAQTSTHHDGPATFELKRLVANNPEVRRLLIASIEQARRVNPDWVTNPAQSLEQYFDFIAWAERALPGNLLKQKPDATLYHRMDQSIGYIFFIVDQPLKELEGRGYPNNSLQYMASFNPWLKTFVRSWASFLDSPESWSKEYLRLAEIDAKFGLNRGWYEDPSHWKTFNQFFARQLKSPEQRPVASPSDESIVTSPVDAVPEGVWPIDSNSRLVGTSGVPVKTGTVQSIEQLIGDHSKYKAAFVGGTFTHVFLDLGDYHHYHFPLSGVVREVNMIPGQEMSGGNVTWDATNRRYAFDPSSVGWQSLEVRGCVILDTENFGLVALLPIGMSPISSVTFESALKERVRVKKGDLMGHFQFGGSDFVMIFQAGYKFTLDGSHTASSEGYSHLLIGERLGELRAAPGAH